MMNVWEPIHGRTEKREPVAHSIPYLALSRGGQGHTVIGVTRMSRGHRRDEAVDYLRTTKDSFRPRSPSPKSPKRAEGPGWYLRDVEVQKHKKETLFQRIGNEIGVERIAKSCLQFANSNDLLQPLVPEISVPLAKTLLAYMLGQPMPDFALAVDDLKKELIRARDELEMTAEHFDEIQKMLQAAIYTYCVNNDMRVRWDTISNCFRKEIEFGRLNKITDKRIVYWEIQLRGLGFLPHDGDTRKIAKDISTASKVMNADPDIARAINRCFFPDGIDVVDLGATQTGVTILFQVLPELYEDRMVLRQVDLAHMSQFVEALHEQFDPEGAVTARKKREAEEAEQQRLEEERRREQEAKDAADKRKRDGWKDSAADVIGDFETTVMGKLMSPDYDGLELENELQMALGQSPKASLLRTYPPISFENNQEQTVFEEQNRRVELLEDQLMKLSHIHAQELTRTRRMLVMAQDRIKELEHLSEMLPTEAVQAQDLIFSITQDSVRRAVRLGEEGMAVGSDAASEVSMQILESCPTPRPGAEGFFTPRVDGVDDLAGMTVGGQQTAASGAFGALGGSAALRLQPGETIDEKLREWIEASKKLLDPRAGRYLDAIDREESERDSFIEADIPKGGRLGLELLGDKVVRVDELQSWILHYDIQPGDVLYQVGQFRFAKLTAEKQHGLVKQLSMPIKEVARVVIKRPAAKKEGDAFAGIGVESGAA